ncbi:DNA polymerase III subunit beta [Heyndrickxia camelliae]|uniref:Beta sliding clamp n=1 Tax=Heyndrickxia camelliae TaxID=1707093 RepID=A0A2N3LDT3_9BACI|nr:DNA polymerase III subunit beta [Heyndrickxia camelliae]PKR82735.1 DNA polymerase III subunit beta [Heyndrickxia camelliae]
MEMVIKKDCFAKAVSDVCRAISFKSSMPVLTGIKLVVIENGLVIVGSNSDIFIEKTIPSFADGVKVLDIIETGSVVISAKYLSEIVKKLSGDIRLRVKNESSVTLASDDVVVNFNGFHAEEYPHLPNMMGADYCKVGWLDLVEMIKQTVFAASANDYHPVLSGVCMTFREKYLSIAATNSHRLAFKKIPLVCEINNNVIVPSKTLHELIKLLNNETEDIHIFITENHIGFKANNVSLFSRLIGGIYPNIDGLLSQQCKTSITLNKNRFLKGIDRACLFASEWKNNNVHIEMQGGIELIISSAATEVGKIRETQPVLKVDGDPEFKITLNGDFLVSALKVIKEDNVIMYFNGHMRPVLIEPVGNSSYYYLISPVRSN